MTPNRVARGFWSRLCREKHVRKAKFAGPSLEHPADQHQGPHVLRRPHPEQPVFARRSPQAAPHADGDGHSSSYYHHGGTSRRPKLACNRQLVWQARPLVQVSRKFSAKRKKRPTASVFEEGEGTKDFLSEDTLNELESPRVCRYQSVPNDSAWIFVIGGTD